MDFSRLTRRLSSSGQDYFSQLSVYNPNPNNNLIPNPNSNPNPNLNPNPNPNPNPNQHTIWRPVRKRSLFMAGGGGGGEGGENFATYCRGKGQLFLAHFFGGAVFS